MVKFQSIKANVSTLFVNDGILYIVDEKNRLLKFDTNLHFIKGYKLNFNPNKPDENGVKFSKNARFLAIASNKELGIWDIAKRKFLKKFVFERDLLSVGFFNQDYLACGGIDGRIHLINLNILEIVATLPRHRDFISDIEFIDEDYLVFGSFDKCVGFINVGSFNKKERYLHIRKVKKVKKDTFLVSADELSDIINWDIFKHTSKDRVDFYRNFRDLWIDENILIISTTKKIMLYDLENEVILNENFIEMDELDKVCVFENKLIISTIGGGLYYRDLFEEEGEMIDALLKEDFKKAYELVDKNPFLKRSKAYERLKKLEESIIKKALILFEESEFEAIKLLQPLLKVPFKQQEIQKLINDYKNLIKFKNAVMNKNYSLAYFLANRYENLKKSKYYEILENEWKRAYERAYEYIIKGEYEKAKEVLKDFNAVEEKRMYIELLFKKIELLKLLREKIAKRDFLGVNELIEAHPELKDSIEYQNLLKYAKNLYEFAQKFLEEEKFDKVKKIINVLKYIPEYKDKAIKLANKLEIILRFLNLIAENRINEAFEMAENYEFLRKLKSYKEIRDKFYSKMKEAEKEYFKNKENAKNMLNKYLQMSTKKARIDSLFER